VSGVATLTVVRYSAARAVLEEGLPGEPVYGHLPDVGAEKGFRYAARGPAPEGTGRARRDAQGCGVVA